jgi:hypothetical protein
MDFTRSLSPASLLTSVCIEYEAEHLLLASRDPINRPHLDPPVLQEPRKPHPTMAITKSQNIIITGGARGIGRNVARYLLSRPENHQVYLLDLNAEELEYAVTQHLSAYAPRVGYAVVNLGKIDEVRAAVNKAADFFDGRIDVLVNNAGNSAHHMSWSDGG